MYNLFTQRLGMRAKYRKIFQKKLFLRLLRIYRRELQERFPDAKITSLNNLTEKITTISNVRTGDEDKRNFYNYVEISLENIDDDGFIVIKDDTTALLPANRSSVYKQALEYGDLLLPIRGEFNKIAMINDYHHYNRRFIIGNNSMLRIRFSKDQIKNNLHKYVKEYLSLPFVMKYINTFIKKNNKRHRPRYLLNPDILRYLPIVVPSESNSFTDAIFEKIKSSKKKIRSQIIAINKDSNQLLTECKQFEHFSMMNHMSQKDLDGFHITKGLVKLLNLNDEIKDMTQLLKVRCDEDRLEKPPVVIKENTSPQYGKLDQLRSMNLQQCKSFANNNQIPLDELQIFLKILNRLSD